MMKHIFLLLLIFLFSTSAAYAASSDFHVKLKVGIDTTAPTTPLGLLAVPAAYSQIDLSWDPSTDETMLGGYQVFRDLVQIATTTLTTYSDTGLTASTTYSYYVKAYDSSFNVSSSSNIVSTTTLTPTATSTSTPSVEHTTPGGSGPGNVTLESFSIVPSLYNAQVAWQTNLYAQFELWWGRTSSYELGFVANNLFKRSNTTVIADLRPGTVYEYQLVAYDKNGIRTVISHGDFKTLDAPDTQAPANVLDLHAIADGNDVKLSWTNPDDTDFSHVRIIRNYLFYPTDPYDGFIAYQDNGTAYQDTGVLGQKDVQYYTVFSYDNSGNVSSGATVEVRSSRYQEPSVEVPVGTSSSFSLSFSDIDFLQNDAAVSPSQIDADSAFTIRIPYEKLPEHLKTIQVTLADPRDMSKVFSFLLKINNEKSYYEATIGALQEVGTYPVHVVVYDYQMQTVTSVDGSITASHKASSLIVSGAIGRRTPITPMSIALVLILLCSLGYVMYRMLKNIDPAYAFLAHLNRTKITISVLLFFVFGGSCAYILVMLMRIGLMTLPSATYPASAAAAHAPVETDVVFVAFILIASVLTVLVVSLVKERSKK